MKILILGNIGAGKTTIGKQLQYKFRYEFCPIDNLRKENGDGTVPGEYLALYYFLKECSNNKNVILEFTGAGCHKYAVKKALEDAQTDVIVIFLDVQINQCKERISDREWDIPIPSWDLDLDQHLKFIDDDIKSDHQIKFWAAPKNFSVIKYSNSNEEDLEVIKQELYAEIKRIYMKDG